jgi:hypothetical protein
MQDNGLPAEAKIAGTAPGQRCHGCGKGRNVQLIRRRKGSPADPWHVECAAQAWNAEREAQKFFRMPEQRKEGQL